jgi:hypothetical protein
MFSEGEIGICLLQLAAVCLLFDTVVLLVPRGTHGSHSPRETRDGHQEEKDCRQEKVQQEVGTTPRSTEEGSQEDQQKEVHR